MGFSPSSSSQWTFRRVMWATLVLVSVACIFWLLYWFHQVVFVLSIAIMLGTVIRPVVTVLHRRGLSQLAGVILVYLLLLALSIGFGLLLFPLIAEQGRTITAAVPGIHAMDAPPLPVINSSMARLTQLIVEAEPTLYAALPVEPSARSLHSAREPALEKYNA